MIKKSLIIIFSVVIGIQFLFLPIVSALNHKEGIDFSKIADKKYLADSIIWLNQQNFENRGKLRFLWQSFKRDSSRSASGYLAGYGRTSTYDNALGIFAELKLGKLAEMQGKNDESNRHIENAKKAVNTLVYLVNWEEIKGFNGLWHFSYNTEGDSFIDPRGPLGANLWALSAIYSYIIQTGDITHLEWINNKMKRFIFGQQIMDEDDKRYGLIRGGLYNKVDFDKGDAMGYGTYTGNPNEQNQNCFLEHNADYICNLRLAAIAESKCNAGKDMDFLNELKKRHELCLKGIANNFWQVDHFCTSMSESGELNSSIAVDNNTFGAAVIMPYDIEKSWRAIQFNKKRFMIKTRLGTKDIEGLFFFTQNFKDPYVNVNENESEKLEKMVQPEATFGYILTLIQYAKNTENKERQSECLDLINRLYNSMITVKEHFKGKGTPYSTHDIKDYFTTLESMASTAMGIIVTSVMLGVDMDDLMNALPPEDFTVDGKKPFAVSNGSQY